MSIATTQARSAGGERRPFRAHLLKQEIDAVLAAGHIPSAWSAADTEVTRDLELLDGAWQCTCACGLMLVAGWDSAGAFIVIRGVSGAYGPHANPHTIDADLDAKRHGPCPAAQALTGLHASDGYQRFAECFND